MVDKKLKDILNTAVHGLKEAEEVPVALGAKVREDHPSDLDEHLEKLAQEHLRIPTLEQRNSDSLDFHDMHVSSIKHALKHAFTMGMSYGHDVGYSKGEGLEPNEAERKLTR